MLNLLKFVWCKKSFNTWGMSAAQGDLHFCVMYLTSSLCPSNLFSHLLIPYEKGNALIHKLFANSQIRTVVSQNAMTVYLSFPNQDTTVHKNEALSFCLVQMIERSLGCILLWHFSVFAFLHLSTFVPLQKVCPCSASYTPCDLCTVIGSAKDFGN